MMTKVALILFGQPRFIENPAIIDSYKANLLDKYDVDVYAHTWYEPNVSYTASTWAHMGEVKASDNTLDIIQHLYSPTQFVHEPPKAFAFGDEIKEFFQNNFRHQAHILNDRNYNNMLSQLYSIQSAARLVENESEYDFIVLGRYDTVLHGFPNLEDLDCNRFYLQNNNPPFPDMIQVFGSKYMIWAKNVLDDLGQCLHLLHEPTPEGLKFATFRKYFVYEDICQHHMQGIAIRN